MGTGCWRSDLRSHRPAASWAMYSRSPTTLHSAERVQCACRGLRHVSLLSCGDRVVDDRRGHRAHVGHLQRSAKRAEVFRMSLHPCVAEKRPAPAWSPRRSPPRRRPSEDGVPRTGQKPATRATSVSMSFSSRIRLPYPRTFGGSHARSEEHTSELQSRQYLVCSLLL